MPSIFLSHNSIDKPFVEKLAKDLRLLGVNVWFDKWEINVGDSILWKIEEGIRENEYLGVVCSPESIKSIWVKAELAAAWQKQLKSNKVIVIPIFYRDCDLPLFLSDRKYADFRVDYQSGLRELAALFGIKHTEIISVDNWRMFSKKRNNVDWKSMRLKEFELLVTALINRAYEYNWSSWIGGTRNPFSITLHAFIERDKKCSITLKLCSSDNSYMANDSDVINPNNLQPSDFKIYVGNTVNECEEFVWRKMQDFRDQFGDPSNKAYHSTFKRLSNIEQTKIIETMIKEMRWYKGDLKV